MYYCNKYVVVTIVANRKNSVCCTCKIISGRAKMHKCSRCNQLMAYVSSNFKPPKKDKSKE